MSSHPTDRIIEKRKWPPKRIAAYGAVAILIIFAFYHIAVRSSGSRLNVETERITISTVTRGPFQEYIPVTGNVIPIKTIYLDAIEGGRVEKLFLEAGTMVEKGQEILEMGNTNLLMDIMFREAELFEQSNNLRNTRLAMEQNKLNLKAELIRLDFDIKTLQRDYLQAKELREQNLISRYEFEQIRDEYDYNLKRRELSIETYNQDSVFREIQIKQLESSLARMERNLDLVKTKLENLTLRAPITGHLTSLNAEIGELKSPGENLGQIDVLEGFKVRASIDEYHLSRIHTGLEGKFDFADQEYRLRTEKIYPEINNGRFDIDLFFEGKEPDNIRRGLTLHIRLELGGLSDAILLPRGGFYQKTGGQWIYVLEPDGKTATRQAIRLGMQNPQMFEVLEGLEPGDQVITSSYDAFGDNDILVLEN